MKRWKSSLLMTGIVALSANILSAAPKQIAAGQYVVVLTPNVDETGADLIEQQVGQLTELKAIDVKPKDSRLYFTVKDNVLVDVPRIEATVRQAVPGTTMSEPIPESRYKVK